MELRNQSFRPIYDYLAMNHSENEENFKFKGEEITLMGDTLRAGYDETYDRHDNGQVKYKE